MATLSYLLTAGDLLSHLAILQREIGIDGVCLSVCIRLSQN